ncbi:NADP-dependent phosphogluconate dehydrogenase [Flavisolibacter tropicus]|uniref:6-phosphogluconate dehydrogenase, decarboxylating n=1 Tax=Flavisolibacter tropicus TaxID=1492898 RepID=A0A172TWS0_9BACT|nr:NADP-dependent phosphogluconate dehydrogenase [Flavisolibacter tropicus]ANE51535.1 6-phosphogluconate dehydrogenase [Flavisolibacter tropicus]
MEEYEFGIVGLGTMGRNLLLNMADQGFSVLGLDLDPLKATVLAKEVGPQQHVKGVSAVVDFVSALRTPRAILMLVPAGKPVDIAISGMLPHLNEGDIIIDGGNTYFTDTDRRALELGKQKIHFFGMGISGGEKGARYGPSMMPGGDRSAYERLRPVFEAIAAKVDGQPCVTWLGNGSAGHYVKMVHNGIEYGIMQLIAEVYDMLKRGLGLPDEAIQQTFDTWDQQELQSYLIKITADIFKTRDPETGQLLVNMIADRARAKGTGKWTSQNAMDLQVPVPVIDTAVMMRDLSAHKEERTLAAQRFSSVINSEQPANMQQTLERLKSALYAATIITYAQGLSQLQVASKAYMYGIELESVARIWRGGCIIRSQSLELFRSAYARNPELINLLLDEEVASIIAQRQADLRWMVMMAVDKGIPAAASMAALSYFDAYRSAHLPGNLIQAQRDFFGAHQYERIDREGVFHTEWE